MDRRNFIKGGIATASVVAMPKILKAEGLRKMKVLLVNGSPNEKGCTYTALKEIADTLEKEGIEPIIYHVGNDPISSCRACGACNNLKKCVIDDKVNEFVELASTCDGFVIGSPVHYASASGATTAFLDRAFYSASRSGKKIFPHKPATAIASARRAGTTATLDQLNKYFTISGMPVASSQYWNSVHGAAPGQAGEDLEGLQTMRTLARNMSFLMKSIALGKEKFGLPEKENHAWTNFIR